MKPIVAIVFCFSLMALCHGFPGGKVTLVKIFSAAPGDLNNFHIHARAFGDYNGYGGFPGGYGGYPLGHRVLHGFPLGYGHAYPFGYGGGHGGGATVHASSSSRSFGHGFGHGFGYNRYY